MDIMRDHLEMLKRHNEQMDKLPSKDREEVRRFADWKLYFLRNPATKIIQKLSQSGIDGMRLPPPTETISLIDQFCLSYQRSLVLEETSEPEQSPLMEECLQGHCDCHPLPPDQFPSETQETETSTPSKTACASACEAELPVVCSPPPSTLSPTPSSVAEAKIKKTHRKLGSCSQRSPKSSKRRARNPCLWSEIFGGICNAELVNEQSHDRHVASHLADEFGKEWAMYYCGKCGKKLSRMDACKRHITQVHKAPIARYFRHIPTPWWWPNPLFKTDDYRKTTLPPPPVAGTTWKEHIDDLIEKCPWVINKPLRKENGLKGKKVALRAVARPRPAKRRRMLYC